MILIDTHLHLLKEYYDDIPSIIRNAIDNDVKYLILGGCSIDNNKENILLAKEYGNIFTTIGYHPDEANSITIDDINNLENQLKSSNVIGIGEIGLDYHLSKENKLIQQQLFIAQIKLANKYNLPIVVHSRDAVEDTINILKNYHCKGIIHCFSGSLEIANKYIEMGYKLGIGGVLTFKNSNLKETLKSISLENIVLETDSPYLSPIRGNKNEPSNIKIIADYLANIKNISIEEVGKITTNNVISLFDLKNIL